MKKTLSTVKTEDIKERIQVREIKPYGVERLKSQIQAIGFDEEEPVLLRRVNGHYRLIDGCHRLEAVIALGIKEIKASIIEDPLSEEEELRLARQRNDTTENIVKTTFYDDFQFIATENSKGKGLEEIAGIMAWSLSKVKNYSALKAVCQEAWQLIRNSEEKTIGESHTCDFSEGLLRHITQLEPGQQIQLIKGLLDGEIQKKDFKDRANFLKKYSFTIDEEFSSILPSLTPVEKDLLEKNILRDGCINPIVLWKNKGKNIIIDGHARYEICIRHYINIPFGYLNFNSREDVKIWILENQCMRKNLGEFEKCYLVGKLYEIQEKKDEIQSETSEIETINHDNLVPIKNITEFINVREIRDSFIEKLQDRIRKHGYNPASLITVRRIDNNYRLIDGKHRFEVAKKLDIEYLPAVIIEDFMTKDEENKLYFEIQSCQEIGKKQTLFDTALFVKDLFSTGKTIEEISLILGWNEERVEKYIKFCELPPEIWSYIAKTFKDTREPYSDEEGKIKQREFTEDEIEYLVPLKLEQQRYLIHDLHKHGLTHKMKKMAKIFLKRNTAIEGVENSCKFTEKRKLTLIEDINKGYWDNDDIDSRLTMLF